MDKSPEKEDKSDQECGFGPFRPKWAQKFANPKIFMLNFALITIVQGAYFPYLIGCTTTLEKRFSYNSRLTGFVLIADNFSQILISPFVGFLGKRMNRATLIAAGMVFISFSCCLTGVPYLLEDRNPHFKAYTGGDNDTRYEYCEKNSHDHCEDSANQSPTNWTAYWIIWFASFLNGVGYTAFYTLGFPYVDDNVSKRNAPLYFSTLTSVRLLGPTVGFLLSSFCLNLYEDPFNPPENMSRKDPRWVGAWWLGFFIIGISIFVCSLPLFFFPKNLKANKKPIENEENTLSKMKEAKQSLKRVLTNPIWVFDTMAGISRFIGYAGYYITQPKYIESQYRQSASQASFFTGTTTIVAMSMGIMAGGIFIRCFQPGPRTLTSLIFLVELFANAGILSGMFLGCPGSQFFGYNDNMKSFNLDANCNAGCECSKTVLQPVCSSDKVTNYFSPCYAGCKDFYTVNATEYFSSCSCDLGIDQTVKAGHCELECNTFVYYITFLSIAKLISSTSRTGNYLVRFRCVEERDKSFAMGILMTVFGTLGAIPYPLIFGAIADSACLIWEESCGSKGNCWLYDADKFRYYLHGASFMFMSIGSFFDLFVIYYSKRMSHLYDDDDDLPPPLDHQMTTKDEKEISRF